MNTRGFKKVTSHDVNAERDFGKNSHGIDRTGEVTVVDYVRQVSRKSSTVTNPE